MGKSTLSPRLAAIEQLMAPRACVADVGCDHGYLIAALVSRGKVQRGLACDLRTGPLSRARQTLEEQGLLDRVELVLTDGLTGLENRGVDGIVIAGMGGDLISEILAAAPWVKDPGIHLVLQPMSKPQVLREFLAREGFRVLREQALEDGGHHYTALSAHWDGVSRTLTPLQALGGKLLENRDLASARLLAHLSQVQQRKGEGLAKGGATQLARQAFDLAKQLEDTSLRMEDLCKETKKKEGSL